jgi:prolyl 4-hydroxylase
LIDFDQRCPYDPDAPTILNPGDVHQLFQNITTLPEYAIYEPRILSMPNPPRRKTDDTTTTHDHDHDDDEIKDGPWVVTLENFLTDEECDTLINLGAVEGYKVSQDVGKRKFDGTYEGHINSGRTSTNAWCLKECFHDPVTQRVLNKIVNVTGVPDENSEYLQLLKYEVGQFYQQHHDYIGHHVQRTEGVRILTVFLYLNDVEAGGGTDFPKVGLTVMPKRGKAVIWPSVLDSDPNAKDDRTDHQALPVEKGIKYGANAWLHQRNFKEAFNRSCH